MEPPRFPDSSRPYAIIFGNGEFAVSVGNMLADLHGYNVLMLSDPGPAAELRETFSELFGDFTGAIQYHPESATDPVLVQRLHWHKAKAVAFLDDDESANLGFAAEIDQQLRELRGANHPRMIVRVRDEAFGDDVVQLFDEHSDCTVVSGTAVAVRSFTAAALNEPPPGILRVWGRTLRLSYHEDQRYEAVWPIADDTSEYLGHNLIPSGDASANVTVHLGLEASHGHRLRTLIRKSIQLPEHLLRHVVRSMVASKRMFNRGLWISAAVLLALLATGTWALAAFPSPAVPVKDAWDAVYVLALLTGSGTNPDLAAHPLVRLTHAVVVISGSLFVPVVTGAVVQAVLDRRYAREEGRIVGAVRGHVIVVGLGTLGVGIVTKLRERRIPVVAIDRDPQSPGIRAARLVGAEVLIGDGTDPMVLKAAEARQAMSLVAAAHAGDFDTLRVVMAARRIAPRLRTVQRIDNDQASQKMRQRLNRERTAGTAHQHATVNSRAVAANVFAALITGGDAHDVISIGDNLLLLRVAAVSAQSALDGALAGHLDEPGVTRLLAILDPSGRVHWQPRMDFSVYAGCRLLVLTTSHGQTGLVRKARTQE